MSVEIHRGKVRFRQWEKSTGLAESEETFATLEELFEICLHRQSDEPLIDQIVIEGSDDQGHAHRLVLRFQSVNE
jgi:hypothetical protein